MTTFEVVEAKPYHCGRIIRRLRDEQAKAMTRVGVNSHKELRERFDESFYRKAWLIDGKLAGIGGVAGMALSSTGYLWLALTEDAARHPVAMVREAKRQADEILRIKNRLMCSVVGENSKAYLFAVFLGFRPIPNCHGDIIPMVLEPYREAA